MLSPQITPCRDTQINFSRVYYQASRKISKDQADKVSILSLFWSALLNSALLSIAHSEMLYKEHRSMEKLTLCTIFRCHRRLPLDNHPYQLLTSKSIITMACNHNQS
jgi:hypothetical protein